MQNARLDEAQAGIKRNINNLRYTDDTTIMAESEEESDESERGEWKSCVKTQHSKTKIMASGHVTSWQIDGETMETVIDYFLGSKITAVVTAAMKLKDACILEEKLWPT